ncbi:MAG TPA: translation initiation factor IF-2 N-terminal domain-containing protein, partial [Vicinamibacterales bacterium]
MATVRIYKVAELLGLSSQDAMTLLRQETGIDVKSASSSIEEIVARQFVERHAKKRQIVLPAGPLFADTAASKKPVKAGKAPEPPKAAVAPRLPRLVKSVRPPAPAVEAPPPVDVTPPAPPPPPPAPVLDVPAPADVPSAAAQIEAPLVSEIVPPAPVERPIVIAEAP